MDDIVCQYKFCSGHGHCVNSSAVGNITCSCISGWTGSKCDVIIPSDTEQLTVGQKLLKEPIWIGMIVMLNLVLFFCVSYVARRKCGKKIARLMPKLKKPQETASKEVSHTKEESTTSARDIYSLHIDIPRSENSSKSLTLKTPTKLLFEKMEISAPPTPTIVDEKAKEAALKLFDAYKSYNSFTPQSAVPRLSGAREDAPIIQGGTVSFIDGISTVDKKDTSPPMIRSLTINSAEYDEGSYAKQKWKQLLRHTRSLPCSPGKNRQTHATQERKPINDSSRGIELPTKSEHCYPVIRILNENNSEQHINSDSENSVIDVKSREICDNAKLSVNMNSGQLSDSITLESNDSGYPTTSVSSRVTQVDETFNDQHRRSPSVTSARERRKLFGDKSKSRSFYDISPGGSHYSAENSSFSTDNDMKAIGIRRSMPDDLNNFSSFDSGYYCVMCRRDRKLDHAASYSCESELNKIHKPHRMYSSETRSKHRRCNCRKCHQRSKSHCRKHLRQFSRDIGSLNISQRHNLADLNIKRSSQRSGRRSNAKSFYTNGSNHSFPGHLKTMHSTSTESDVCDCSRSKTRSRRKCYRRTEHYSDDSWKSQQVRPNLALIKGSAASWELSRDECHQRKVVDPYLANVQRHRYSNINHSLAVEHQCCNQYLSNDSLMQHGYNQNQLRSLRKTHSAIEMSELTEMNPFLQPENLTDVEVVSSRLSTDAYLVSQSLDKLDALSVEKLETTPQSTSSSDRASKLFEDSAYQTKQSSIDRYNSIKDKNGVVESKKKGRQADSVNSYRTEDKVGRHLYQAAQKLALIKRLQTAQEQYSKDSAVYTFSEDDLSADDQDPRSLKPLVKRTSGIAFQMKEMNLSEVKEEYSGVSHGSYNTPNNEPAVDQSERQKDDRHTDEFKVVVPLSNLCRTGSGVINYRDHIEYLDETKV